jgi:RHS repeat-associated protein
MPIGNVSKSGSISWQPTYNSPANNNQYLTGWNGASYDADGSLLNDTFNTYTWDAYGNLTSANTAAITYDAFGRMAENQNGTYEFFYAPTGTQPLAWLQGQTLAGAHVPLPAGAFAVYNGSGIFQYNHADWLGSARLFSTPTRTASMAMSYAPFGEGYASGIQDIQFTSYGSSFTVSGNESQGGTLDDFTFRRYSPVQGRWISPDPAGLGAADPGNPQSWNRYAYVANKPLTYVDPLGLFMLCCQQDDGGGGGDDPSGGDPCFLYGLNCGSQPPDVPPGTPGGTGGPAKPLPKPPRLQRGQPQCFAQLKSRGVQDARAQLVSATHSFWYVQDSLGNQSVVSGGPSNGSLDVWTNDDISGQTDNTSATTSWNSGVSSDNCNGADDLLTAADTWPQNTIPYSPLGPNSNSVANYMGQAGGFNPSAPSGSVGWNTPILFPGFPGQ